MTSVSNQGWKKWLNEHTSRSTYDSHPERVAGLLADPGSAETKFEKLARSKNLVLLTKAPIGKKCVATFYHSVVGCPITPEDLHFVAKSGMETGAGVEMEPQSIFVRTAAKFVPSVGGSDEGSINHSSGRS